MNYLQTQRNICKQFLEIGGRDLLVKWLENIQHEEDITRETAQLLEYILKILDLVSWNSEIVVATRIDRVFISLTNSTSLL